MHSISISIIFNEVALYIILIGSIPDLINDFVNLNDSRRATFGST